MFGYGKNPRTALERDQQYQIERLEREAEQNRREDDERREASRRERQERYREVQHSADTWPEALRKQIHLYQQEQDSVDDGDMYFGNSAQACREALELWHAAEEQAGPRIAEL